MSYDPASGGQPPSGQGWPGGGQQGYPPASGYGQQPPAGWGPAPGQGGPGGTPTRSNSLSALFDFNFTSFATPGLVKILYILGTVLLVLAWLGYTIAAFAAINAGVGVLVLILGAVIVLFYLAFLRVMLEFVYAVVRMSDDIHNRR